MTESKDTSMIQPGIQAKDFSAEMQSSQGGMSALANVLKMAKN